MNKKEFRIGNAISIKETEAVTFITHLHPFDFSTDLFSCLGYDEINPIPITEEWLLKCGIESCMDDPECKGFLEPNGEYILPKLCDNLRLSVLFGFDKNHPVYVEVGDDPLYHIKYVHQLQNLYFALTGEELTYAKH